MGSSEDITVRIKKNGLKRFGHVERMTDERIVKMIYEAIVIGQRGKKRPQLTFKNTVYR